MDEQRAVQDGRVAAAADAWLTDPLDADVYRRLVLAVRDRRAYLDVRLNPPDDKREDAAPQACSPVHTQLDQEPDEVLDDLDERHAVQPLGASLSGADPREILDRLRGNRPRGR